MLLLNFLTVTSTFFFKYKNVKIGIVVVGLNDKVRFTSLVTWLICSCLDTSLCVLKSFNGNSYAHESNFIP